MSGPYDKKEVEILVSGNLRPLELSMTASGYICGDCGSVNTLGGADQIRCAACGYRILYKKRQRLCNG